MNFLENLCSCFSPELRKNIIDYLSSSKLNSQVIEEEKCSQENEAPAQSIYAQCKTKSYYFMKLNEVEDNSSKLHTGEQIVSEDNIQPNYYPNDPQGNSMYDQLYQKKLGALRLLLGSELGAEYSKIYDSQDDIGLKIYYKQEIYQGKRFNSYRFTFKITKNGDGRSFQPQDYLKLAYEGDNGNLNQPLLKSRKILSVTDGGVQVCHRQYNKVLVINQHDFYSGQKCEALQEEGATVVYNTVFSVKGDGIKLVDYSRGWINLSGLRVSNGKIEQEEGNSLVVQDNFLQFDGYINIQIDISVNPSMLKQPIAKQVRIYVQKLICALTKSDAI